MGAIVTEIVDRREKRDLGGRRVFPRDERRRLLDLRHASGMTVAEFARQESTNYSTMVEWVARSVTYNERLSRVRRRRNSYRSLNYVAGTWLP